MRILCLFACSLSLSLSLSSLSHCYKLILRLSFLSIPVFEKSDKSIGNAFFFFLFFSLSLSLSLTNFICFIFSRTTHSQLSLDISSLSFTCTCRFQLLESKAQNSPLSISFLRSRSFVSLSCTADC